MILSKKAQTLLDHLTAIGGGAISEIAIRAALGISHGSFIAARRELVKNNCIECQSRGGNLPAIYTIEKKLKPKPEKKAPKPPRLQSPVMQSIDAMPSVIGTFSSFDDWADALMGALGDCIDITQSLVSDNEYTVFSHAHVQQTLYHVTFTDCGIIAELAD